MRLSRVLAGAALAAAPFAPLTMDAQTTEPPAVAFGILGGATFPVGDYSKAAATGFNVGAFADFGRRLGPLGIRADVLYHGFGDSDPIQTAGPGTTFDLSNKYSMVTGTLNGVFGIPVENSPIRPYLTAGVGAYYIKDSPRCVTDSTTCTSFVRDLGDDNTTKFGINGGAGIEFGLGGAAAFLEARFHNVFQGTPDLTCTEASCNRLALQMVPVNLGVRFQF